eukprot:3196535-Rhodomonas_salina.1
MIPGVDLAPPLPVDAAAETNLPLCSLPSAALLRAVHRLLLNHYCTACSCFPPTIALALAADSLSPSPLPLQLTWPRQRTPSPSSDSAAPSRPR